MARAAASSRATSTAITAAAALFALSAQGGMRRAEPIRGITLAPIEDSRLGDVGYGSAPCAAALVGIAETGAGWVSLTPFGRMDDLDSVEIEPDFEIPVARNEELLRRTAAEARAAGLKVAVIPHVYVLSGLWRGEIDPGSPERLEAWFSSYDAFVARFAALAEDIRADLFSVGVEMKSTTNGFPERWRETIALVRSIYRGPLTYSANWDEVEEVEFWDALDAIGVNAFWPLTGEPGERYDAMVVRAAAIARDLEALAVLWDRPVIFAEFGVKSARDSALAPWEWPEHLGTLDYDEAYQAEAYQAVLEELAPSPWFLGLFVWKYFSDPDDRTQEPRTGFSPKGKAAEAVLRAWYRAPWDVPGPDLCACETLRDSQYSTVE